MNRVVLSTTKFHPHQLNVKKKNLFLALFCYALPIICLSNLTVHTVTCIFSNSFATSHGLRRTTGSVLSASLVGAASTASVNLSSLTGAVSTAVFVSFPSKSEGRLNHAISKMDRTSVASTSSVFTIAVKQERRRAGSIR